MVTIDITLLIHVINMFILMAVLNVILYKPVQAILAGREKRKDTLRGEVGRFEENARHRQEEVDKKMREASARAKAALDGARAEAQATGNTKLAASRSESDASKEKQLADIRSQVQAAAAVLQSKTKEFAADMAGKILGRSIEA